MRIALLFWLQLVSALSLAAPPRPIQRDPIAAAQVRPIERFAVTGDSGSGAQVEHDLARQLSRENSRQKLDALFLLGDNVYEHGEVANFDRAIRYPFRQLIEHQVPVLGVLGNHDILSDPGFAQLSYLGLDGKRQFRLKLAHDIELFAIDTTLLMAGQRNYYPHDTKWANAESAAQLEWLERSLGESRARMKIVFGHHPLYSSGEHGQDRDGTIMKEALEPMLVRHGVSAYFAGHDHHYERSEPINGITHIVTGAGGKTSDRYHRDAPHPRVHIEATNHVLLLDARPEGLGVRAIDRNGKTLDETTIAAPSMVK